MSSGDIPAALECLTKHDAELTAANCQLPKEALDLLRMAVESPEELAEGLRRSDVAAIVTTENLGPALADFAMKVDDSKLPTVFGHGMGDSCFNSGMKQITADTGKHIGKFFMVYFFSLTNVFFFDQWISAAPSLTFSFFLFFFFFSFFLFLPSSFTQDPMPSASQPATTSLVILLMVFS